LGSGYKSSISFKTRRYLHNCVDDNSMESTMDTNLVNVGNEDIRKALNIYFDINTRPEIPMFIERIYGDMCERLEVEPEVDLDNQYVDSAYYQRTIVCETIKLLLTASFKAEDIEDIIEELESIKAHMEEVEGSFDVGDEDDDDVEVDEDEVLTFASSIGINEDEEDEDDDILDDDVEDLKDEN
jgi:hypothetical protein